MDNKEQNDLLYISDMLKNMVVKWEEKQEAKLWQEINPPFTLEGLLPRLTKDDLQEIRRNLNLKKLSALKKDELVMSLAELIPEKVETIFLRFDLERYRLAKEALENDGVVWNPSIANSKVLYLMRRGLMFPGLINGKRVLVMPDRLRSVMQKLDGPELLDKVKRNDEWIHLTHGMLYYYGVMESNQMFKMIRELNHQTFDSIDIYSNRTSNYIYVIGEAMDYYRRIRYGKYFTYCDSRVFNEESILKEHRDRTEISYYPFSIEQLLLAGSEGYVEITPEMNRLIDHLIHYYGFTREKALEIATTCMDLIQKDVMPSHLLKYLEVEVGAFASTEAIKEIMQIIIDLSNNTRMWILKGYTPNELKNWKRNENKVIHISSRTKKVGRNDLCPCGSGKKYKKCCLISNPN